MKYWSFAIENIMSAHLVCVTSGSGLPLLSKSKGNTENVSLQVMFM